MKKFLTAAVVALVICAFDARAAHLQAEGVRVGPLAEEKAADSGGANTPKKDAKKEPGKSTPSAAPKSERRNETTGEPAEGGKKAQVAEKSQNPAALSTAAASNVAPADANKSSATSDAPARPGTPAPVPVNTPSKPTPVEANNSDSNRSPANVPSPNPTSGTDNSAAATALTPAASLVSVYRIGIGDVLDIRLLNMPETKQSTLYTVVAGGVLDYPMLHDPLTVAGMTTEELAAQLVAELRHRGIYDRPQVRVSVREYASHAVLVSGLVGDPGTKILRREAIPLYVVIAEAQPRPEAGRAVVVSHATGQSFTVDLNDAAALNTLVQAGDVINLTVRPPEFFYVGGEINSPGQKDFHYGMTLTQAVLASGGVSRLAGERVRVARQGADGRLVSTEYNLKQIEDGLVPDPPVQSGDRIEVSRRKEK
jgi:protein involved in polysaccharide export with SLBB domain